MTRLLLDLASQGLQMTLILLAAPLLAGWTRLLRARLLRRRGPSLLQPFRDLLRLLRKEPVLAPTASWVFRTAPYVIFVTVWIAAALVPSWSTGLMFAWATDLVALVAFLGTARFALALAGMDVGTSFGGIGSSREMLIASLAEPAMLMVVFTMALLAGSTRLDAIVHFLLDEPVGLRVSLGLALVALLMVAIAENARVPIDNPTTHLELTMVHEAMLLEYSGRHLALVEASAALKLAAYLSLVACLFFPFGMVEGGLAHGLAPLAILAWLGKLAVLGTGLALLEVAIAKMRVFRVPEFLGGALALGFLGTLLLFVSRSL